MACNHADFVAFDLSRENHLRRSHHNPLPQLSRHLVSAVFIHTQLASDLPVRQIQTHEVQAQQPDSQRLMMPREKGVGEIIKTPPAVATQVTLPIRLSLIHPPLRLAMRATHPPGQRSFRTIAKHFASSINGKRARSIRGAPRQTHGPVHTAPSHVLPPMRLTAYSTLEQTSPKHRLSHPNFNNITSTGCEWFYPWSLLPTSCHGSRWHSGPRPSAGSRGCSSDSAGRRRAGSRCR